MQKLHRFKQIIVGIMKMKEGIKWHMVLHIPFYISWFGPATVFDMLVTEREMSALKKHFDSTSKRLGTTFEEILTKNNRIRVLRQAWEETVGHTLSNATHQERGRMYETEENIIFQSTTGSTYRCRLIYSEMFHFTEGKPFLSVALIIFCFCIYR